MSGQGYRTRRGHVPPRPLPPRAGSRDGWTTREAGGVNHRSWCPAVMFEPPELCGCGAERAGWSPPVPPPDRVIRDDVPLWIWPAVLAIYLIFLIVLLGAFR